MTRGNRTALNLAIEAGWLACIALIPLAAMPEGSIAGFIGAPKVFLLRTITLAITALVIIDRTPALLAGPRAERSFGDDANTFLREAISGVRANPILLGATAVFIATTLSFALSPIMSISWAGYEPGYDTYAMLNVIPYFIIFGAIAAYLRTKQQVRRLAWVITGSALLLGIYGITERYGFELLEADAMPSGRVTLTFGNAIFSSAYILMTIPLTLALWQDYRGRFTPLIHSLLGAALIAPQVFSVVFSFSRGPNISLVFGLVVFLALSAWVYGRKAAGWPALSIALAFLFTLMMNLIPVPGVTDSSSQLGTRIGSIGSAFTQSGGGLTGRYSTWQKSLTIFSSIPWVDDQLYPELPSLPLARLRRVFGYGPDMYGDVYQIVGGGGEGSGGGALARHAHSFPLHILVELGLLGLIAYITLLGGIGFILFRLLRAARNSNTPTFIGHISIGLSAIFMARMLEQTAGKAQISDLTLSWALAGLIAALFMMEVVPTVTSSKIASRRRAPRSRYQRRSSDTNAQLLIGSLVALAALFAWWQVPLTDARSLVLTARGSAAGADGDAALSGDYFTKAIDVAPSAPVPRLILVQGLMKAASEDPDPATSLDTLTLAYELNDGMRDRQPTAHRAWQLAGRISLAQAQLDPGFWDVAIHDNTVATHVNPGQWPPLEQLSWTLALAGQHDRALLAASAARELGAEDNPKAYFVYYIEALLEGDRGNFEASDAALTILQSFNHPDIPRLVNDIRSLER